MQFSEWIAREFAARGYELLPVELAAEDVGASQRRERIFFVAYSSGLQSERRRELENLACETRATESNSAERKRMWHAAFNCGSNVANADSVRQQQPGGQFAESGQWAGDGSEALANTSNARLERQRNGAVGASAELALSSCFGGYQWPARPGQPQHGWEESRTIELPLGGAVARLPVRLVRRHRVASLKALGNAIVPQVAEVIGRAIMEASQNELR
jgi:DNA (cytosine-5)-methyltransferase 1